MVVEATPVGVVGAASVEEEASDVGLECMAWGSAIAEAVAVTVAVVRCRA